MKKSFWGILIASFLSIAMVGTASALMIDGTITFGGNAITSTPTALDLENATGIVFGNVIVTDGLGDFAGLAGNTVTIKNFDFNPFVAVEDFWSVGGFTFDLNILGPISQGTVQVGPTAGAQFLNLSGEGIVSANGFEDTVGNWTLSADIPNDAQLISWSSNTVAEPIPEPATMLLFGTGLVGLAGLGRRKLRKK